LLVPGQPLNLPREIQRREDRRAAIAAAQQTIEAQARYEREQAEYEAKLANRRDREQATGKKARGKTPTPPTPGPTPKDPVNLTDEASRIMPGAGGGFEQCYNAQAVVEVESLLILVPNVTQDVNDKQQLEPALERLATIPPEVARPECLLMDAGFFSEQNVKACLLAKIEPLIAIGREHHHTPWQERFGDDPPPVPEDASPLEPMKSRLKTRAGRALYALRKQTVEPVLGIIKSVMGFRQFLTGGLENVRNEGTLVSLAWNLKRMAVLRPQ